MVSAQNIKHIQFEDNRQRVVGLKNLKNEKPFVTPSYLKILAVDIDNMQTCPTDNQAVYDLHSFKSSISKYSRSSIKKSVSRGYTADNINNPIDKQASFNAIKQIIEKTQASNETQQRVNS